MINDNSYFHKKANKEHVSQIHIYIVCMHLFVVFFVVVVVKVHKVWAKNEIEEKHFFPNKRGAVLFRLKLEDENVICLYFFLCGKNMLHFK